VRFILKAVWDCGILLSSQVKVQIVAERLSLAKLVTADFNYILYRGT